MENVGEGLKNLGQIDISLKVGLGIAAATGTLSAITLPTAKQQERAALDLFDKPLARLTPQERKAAQFQAGYARWQGFWESKFYPLTRKLPGAQNPILNPYRGLEPMAGQEGDED